MTIDETDGARTTAWSAGHSSPRPSADDDALEEGLARSGRRRLFIAIGSVAAVAFALFIAVVLLGGNKRKGANGVVESSAQSSENQWWSPPSGSRTSVEALAYAFATIDERSLGACFDADLQPVYGDPVLFEEHAPRRLRRDEVSHAWIKLRDKLQLRAGFDYLVVRASGGYTSDKEYQLYRALEIEEVISVDESKRMRRPSDRAVFYLAEVHRGHAYDMLIEGDYRAIDAGLDVRVKVPVSASLLASSERLKITHQGLGLVPTGDEAIFAMTPEALHQSYRPSGDPVIVKLVFRTIPGRSVEKQELPRAKILVDETVTLDDGKYKEFDVRPGKYRVVVSSEPHGVRLLPAGNLSCNPALPDKDEYRSFDAKCTLKRRTQLRVLNHTGLIPGPPETVSLYIAKLPD